MLGGPSSFTLGTVSPNVTDRTAAPMTPPKRRS